MSIEATLERIAAALEAIANNSPVLVPAADAAPEKPKRAPSAPKPSAETTSPTAGTKEETPSGEATGNQAVASDTAGDPSELTYEADVKPLILKVGGTKGRDAAIGLLNEFEVDKGDKLDPAQWPAFIARANEVLG